MLRWIGLLVCLFGISLGFVFDFLGFVVLYCWYLDDFCCVLVW